MLAVSSMVVTTVCAVTELPGLNWNRPTVPPMGLLIVRLSSASLAFCSSSAAFSTASCAALSCTVVAALALDSSPVRARETSASFLARVARSKAMRSASESRWPITSPAAICWPGRTTRSCSVPAAGDMTVTECAASPSPMAIRLSLMLARPTGAVTTTMSRWKRRPPPAPGRAPPGAACCWGVPAAAPPPCRWPAGRCPPSAAPAPGVGASGVVAASAGSVMPKRSSVSAASGTNQI